MPVTNYPQQVCVKTCDCNATLANTNIGCVTTKAVEKQTWIMNEIGSTGAKNFIDLTVALDDTYFSALINAANPLNRLYPLPEIKNVNDVRDKPVVYTWKDGTEVFVRDGVRKFEGAFPPDVASPQLLGILEGQRCAVPCKFAIDANGTIWGKISADGTKLYPVKMDAKSIAGIYVNSTDTEPTMLMYSFNLHPSERDCQLRGIPAAQLTGDINPLDYEGLMDVYGKVITCTATKLVITLYNRWGNPLAPETVKNLLVGDFTMTKVASPYTATPSPVALTGTGAVFSEASGTYSITYKTSDDPSVTDHLSLIGSKVGYDFTALTATTIVVS